MTLTLTDDQQMIRDEARRFLADRASAQSLRHHVETGTGSDAVLWQAMAGDLGWAAMALPEAAGGLDQGETELLLLIEATGAALAAVPFWTTTCLAAPLLIKTGGAVAVGYLQRIAAGEAATLALSDPRQASGGTITATAVPDGAGYRLSGRFSYVIDLAATGILLVPALVQGQPALFALEAGQGSRSPCATMDATRPVGQLVLEDLGLPVTARVDVDGLAAAAWDHALAQARFGLAGEQIGLAAALAEMTLAYIKERVQFGRSIASFQAIKHRCAALQVDLAEARSLAYGVAAGFRSTPPAEREMEISALKALADRLALKAAREAIQMHGGVAMTWEYDPHFWLKRVQVNSSLLGRADQHFESLAATLLDGAGA